MCIATTLGQIMPPYATHSYRYIYTHIMLNWHIRHTNQVYVGKTNVYHNRAILKRSDPYTCLTHTRMQNYAVNQNVRQKLCDVRHHSKCLQLCYMLKNMQKHFYR